MSYYDFIRRHVFARAGMRQSDFYTKPQLLEGTDIAHPYHLTSGQREDLLFHPLYPFTGGPDGGAYSTLSDLAAFARALHTGKLIPRSHVELVTTGKVDRPAEEYGSAVQKAAYGYGFLDLHAGGQRIVGHSGSAPGRATNLDIHPDQQWVAIILTNYGPPNDPIDPTVNLERLLITQQLEGQACDGCS